MYLARHPANSGEQALDDSIYVVHASGCARELEIAGFDRVDAAATEVDDVPALGGQLPHDGPSPAVQLGRFDESVHHHLGPHRMWLEVGRGGGYPGRAATGGPGGTHALNDSWQDRECLAAALLRSKPNPVIRFGEIFHKRVASGPASVVVQDPQAVLCQGMPVVSRSL